MDKTMCFLRYGCCLGILLGLGWPLRAGAQIQANAAFDRSGIEAGDTFSLRVLVSGARVAPKRVSFAAWNHQLPPENILSRSEWSRSGAQWVQRFTLITFDSATLDLPPLTVQLHLEDTVQTNPLQLQVGASHTRAELRDADGIRDIRREPTQWYDYWPWALGALVVVFLAARYLRRKRKRPKPAVVPLAPLAPPAPPAHVVALEKLDALEQRQLWQNDQLSEYYAGISLIVREFLEHRYAIPALESTTREIETLLNNTPFPDKQKAPLNHLLQQSDLVKYAEIPPPKSYHEQAMEKARTLVRQTA